MNRSPRAALRKMDPNLKPEAVEYPYALVLLTACAVGPNADKIARRARMPRSEARRVAADCRRRGIFKGRYIHDSGWFDKKYGAFNFWLDVAVAVGWMQRVPPEVGPSMSTNQLFNPEGVMP